MKPECNKLLNCIDLFSGAGGFSLSAKLAGLKVRLAIENNPHAIDTYRNNLCEEEENSTVVIDKDISTLTPIDIHSEHFNDNPRCDLLLGGPPCQGFSAHRIKDAGVGDSRNSLIHIYFEFVRTFKPTAFLMENVPGMLWPRHKDYLERFFMEAREAEYFLYDPVVLDSRDYGVPQRRKRVFILGIKKGVDISNFIWPPTESHGKHEKHLKNPNLTPWINCADAFTKPVPKDDPNDIHMHHSNELVNAFKRTPPNGGSRKDSGRVLKCHEEYDGHNDVYGRIDSRAPAPTMTTACINPSKGRFVHPVEHHGITVRQAARLQTFPDDFIFEGGLIAAGQQIGNAVPIKLGQVLIEHIKPLLEAQHYAQNPPETCKKYQIA